MPSTRLQLRVSRGAAHSTAAGRYGPDRQRPGWTVRVAAPPADGQANDAVLRFLTDALSLTRHDVTIVAEFTARDTVVAVAGLHPAETDRRLALAVRADGHPMPGKDAT